MAVKTIKQRYESRGEEFDTKKEADRHEELCQARDDLHDAQRNYQRLLAESCKTADGFQFEFGVFHDYWQVFVPYGSVPYLRQTCYLCGSWRVQEDPSKIEISEDPKDDKEYRWWVPITELYADRKNAMKALLAAKRKWLADRASDLAEEEKKAELK